MLTPPTHRRKKQTNVWSKLENDWCFIFVLGVATALECASAMRNHNASLELLNPVMGTNEGSKKKKTKQTKNKTKKKQEKKPGKTESLKKTTTLSRLSLSKFLDRCRVFRLIFFPQYFYNTCRDWPRPKPLSVACCVFVLILSSLPVMTQWPVCFARRAGASCKVS